MEKTTRNRVLAFAGILLVAGAITGAVLYNKAQAKKEEEEIAVIGKFLPKQLSAEDLKDALIKIIAETGASSPADLGKVMGIASKQFAGKADGKTISALVKELLT